MTQGEEHILFMAVDRARTGTKGPEKYKHLIVLQALQELIEAFDLCEEVVVYLTKRDEG